MIMLLNTLRTLTCNQSTRTSCHATICDACESLIGCKMPPAPPQKKRGGASSYLGRRMHEHFIPPVPAGKRLRIWMADLIQPWLKIKVGPTDTRILCWYLGAYEGVCGGRASERERKESTSHVSDNKSTCKERPLATGCGAQKKETKKRRDVSNFRLQLL